MVIVVGRGDGVIVGMKLPLVYHCSSTSGCHPPAQYISLHRALLCSNICPFDVKELRFTIKNPGEYYLGP